MNKHKAPAPGNNMDPAVVAGFGDEWQRFNQHSASVVEEKQVYDWYFSIFPWDKLPPHAVGMDVGCGSGRWARQVAPRVGGLHCLDASSEALAVARTNLREQANCQFHHASVDAIPIADHSLDFAYSLGVLHHVPDTAAAIRSCAVKLKPGAPFLIYLYYAFDNRPWWFEKVWKLSELGRNRVSRLPMNLRYWASQMLAAGVYFPLARTSAILERCGVDVANIPLSSYRKRSFYMMRTDALDRFGTSLEQRFTRAQITHMLEAAGFTDVQFSSGIPYWVAVAIKK